MITLLHIGTVWFAFNALVIELAIQGRIRFPTRPGQ